MFEFPDGPGYAAIAKAALYDYSGMRLKAEGNRIDPNELTREGIRGIEVNLHKNGHLPPSHYPVNRHNPCDDGRKQGFQDRFSNQARLMEYWEKP